jgi:GNAT superfamily N-acetyltransferase
MDEELTIRPARPDDRPAMEHITAHTWENGDYIPQVWDEWLADENGVLTVGEWGGPGGPVVAISKITVQPEGQIWLEGMRVDPDYRERGIASRFLQFNLEYGRSHGARVVRLATSFRNTAVHHMVAHQGMERVGAYGVWNAEPLAEGSRPAFLAPVDAAVVDEFLRHSAVLVHAHGLYTQDWAAQELSAERTAELLARGRVAAQRAADGQIAALAVVEAEPGDDEMWIGFADGQPEAVTDLATQIRTYAAQAGVDRIRLMIPDLDWLREAFRAAGYDWGDWDGELWIFESRLPEPPGEDPPGRQGRP